MRQKNDRSFSRQWRWKDEQLPQIGTKQKKSEVTRTPIEVVPPSPLSTKTQNKAHHDNAYKQCQRVPEAMFMPKAQ